MASAKATEQIWQNLSVEALAILAGTDLITGELADAVTVDRAIEYAPDSRYSVGEKSLSEHLVAFESQNNARNLIEEDHEHVLHPDYNTPFTSYDDALDRLLPYHVFQVPDSETPESSREDALNDAVVYDFYRRRQNIYDRFARARRSNTLSSAHSNVILRQVNGLMKQDNVRLAQQIRQLKSTAGDSRPQKAEPSSHSSSHSSSSRTNPNSAQIPLTIPYTRLGQLMSLGITPVPIANVGRGDRPACVLHSIMQSRSMVHLVVNFGNLEPRQVNSLAQLLRTWVAENERNERNETSNAANDSTANGSQTDTNAGS
ncbi:hypothetical protein E3P99_02492 [Wallemia hederae]|uniref:GLTSCR protein conserved domain-containing protein n=1 Tax=Wallemia hederae TaxID=1540922 RepID=A0A4T0FJT7_9BASI|nr:hypothetical protein E3P99_02492 [Wallemia hederae]